VKIKKDSIYNYIVYRINIHPTLLEKDEFPNEVGIYKNIKTAYFIDEIYNNQTSNIVSELTDKEFYDKKSLSMLFNYPYRLYSMIKPALSTEKIFKFWLLLTIRKRI